MSARRAVLALAMMSALIASAISVSSASAATSGTTAFTCTEAATLKPFSDEHCLTRPGGTGNKFGHVVIPVNTPTAITGSNAKTGSSTTAAVAPILNGTIAGIAVEITCTTVSSSGTLENQLLGEEHHITGTGIVITYTGCTMPKPAGGKCKIKEGKIVTNSLKSTSSGATSILFSPTTGTEFVKINTEGCETASLNGAFPVIGTVPAKPNGATLEVTKEGTETTLKFAGQKATLSQTETLRMKEGSPIVATPAPFGTE